MGREKTSSQRSIFTRFKIIIKGIYNIAFSPLGRRKPRFPPQESTAAPSTRTESDTLSTTTTAVATTGYHDEFQAAIAHLQAAYSTADAYLPPYLWDALNPTERFACVGDLCAHIGDQVPVQVVKLIARDVLRALQRHHEQEDEPYRGNLCSAISVLSPWPLSFN